MFTPGPDSKSRMITSISLHEGYLSVSGRAELLVGGPQSSKRPTVHLKLALPFTSRRKLVRSLVSRNLTVAWNVSEEEPTCPASSFFEIQLLAPFDLHSVLMHLAASGPLNGMNSQRTPNQLANQGRIVLATSFALCPSTRVGPQQLPGAPGPCVV
jgi:hypothetical protein